MERGRRAAGNHHLREERLRRGWTQQEVADHVGTTTNTVSRWELGQSQPGPYFRSRLCALFGKGTQELGLFAEQAGTRPDGRTPGGQQADALPPPSTRPRLPCAVAYPRNPFFTGRSRLLAALDETFGSNGAAWMVVLCGLGGIGKTQTAVEYAYRYQQEYQAVLWAGAESREVLLADFASLAQVLCLPQGDHQDQPQAIAAVRSWFATHAGWLLILDNVEDLDTVAQLLPPAHRGHVLVTTRTPVVGVLGSCLTLESMSAEEGALLLLRRSKRISMGDRLDDVAPPLRGEALRLAEELAGLPLALDQAGAYLEETAGTLSDYLGYYHARRDHLLSRRGSRHGHPDSVTTTFSLALERVEQANPAAGELLCLCAFLHPDALPEELLIRGAVHLGPTLQQTLGDPFLFDVALGELRRHSLVQRQPERRTLSMHRLVQAVIKGRIEAGRQRVWAERAVLAVNAALPDMSGAVSTVQTQSNIGQWQRGLAHALACTELIAQYRLTSAEAIHLLQQTGHYLRCCEAYSRAEALFRHALEVIRQAWGPSNEHTARSLADLADLFVFEGKYDLAEPLFQEALAMLEQVLGPEHPSIATCLDNLAILLNLQGREAEAESLHRQGLALREKLLGGEHPETIESLLNLAAVLIEQGRVDEAEPYYLRVLARYERQPEQADTVLAVTCLWIGKVYRLQGRHAEAEGQVRRAQAIFEQMWGPNSSDVADCLYNLANLCGEQGQYDRAIALYQQAMGIFSRERGAQHPRVANCLYQLAALAYQQEHYLEAETLCRQSLSLRQSTFRGGHPAVEDSRTLLARILAAQGRSRERKAEGEEFP